MQRPLLDDTTLTTDIHTPVGFEAAITAIQRPQTHALDTTATVNGHQAQYIQYNAQGMDHILERVVKETHFRISVDLAHYFPLIQLVSFLE